MKERVKYDAIIVVTPEDFVRLRTQHARIVGLLPVHRILFVGRDKVGEMLEREIAEGVFPAPCRGRVGFLAEDSILPFADVQKVMNRLGGHRYKDGQVPRNIVGWYYQQFVKFAYADICEDEYYMTWDGDTVPCREFSMFSETDVGTPYLDYKREYHEEYFSTMKNLIGLCKVIEPSFISEHLLFRRDLVHALRGRIENNTAISGSCWWEKILYAIRPEKLLENSFSEFETYGTFAALTAPGAYRLREWHSFRYAAEFFEIDKINDDDYAWLARDFAAVSFEKNMSVKEEHRNLFDNPYYQERLSARQMLEIAQQEFQGESYIEKWDLPNQRGEGS